MTLTIEELVAAGWSEKDLIEFWEHDNKGWQLHKVAQHFYLSPQSLERWWPLKDVHEFCLKLCAIYATCNVPFVRELPEYLWAKWFRPGDTPCRFGNFFSRFIGSYESESPKTIPELLEAHRCICAQVLLRQVILHPNDDKPRPQSLDDRFDDPHENHENYRLEAIFHAVFIVIDKIPPSDSFHKLSYNKRGPWVGALQVLLVRTGEFQDLRTGPVDFGSIENVSEQVDGSADVRRIALSDAVDFILDLERRNNEIY
ncbi:MAG: hypothetical protein Q9225_000474 [Loekoesia sp. 1 TL-2023]